MILGCFIADLALICSKNAIKKITLISDISDLTGLSPEEFLKL